MARRKYRKEKRVHLFDILYTVIVSCAALCFYAVLTYGKESLDPRFGLFVLCAYVLFMAAGVVIRNVISPVISRRMDKRELSNIASMFFGKIHLPLAVITPQGDITVSNVAFEKEFLRGQHRARISIYDVFKFRSENDNRLTFDDGARFECEFGDRLFAVTAADLGTNGNIMLIFEERTENRMLLEKYENARTVLAYIELDNISDLSTGNFAQRNKGALDAFDALVKDWAEKRGIVICERDNWRYLAVMTEQMLCELTEERFSSLLNPALEIKTDNGVNLSFSLGTSSITDIGIEGGIELRNESALSAFEMAVNRGGATVAVKSDTKMEYFGGDLKSQPKKVKTQARHNAKLLKQLIEDSENVLIMGHATPDYDCIGAQMGIFLLCRELGKRAYIVSNERTYFNITEALGVIDRVKLSPAYRDVFITPDAAIDKNQTGTLLVCVDVSNREKMESAAIFDAVETVAIVDHHRKYAEFDKPIEFEYIDTSASSASELVAEMLEMLYLSPSAIMRDEATMMLSGIYLDTDSFRKTTGTRTFAAALYLRDVGADIDTVKRFFDISVNELTVESRMSESAEMIEGNMAIICYDTHGEQVDPKTRARVADSFVRAKEVEAAFVLSGEAEGPVTLSARSAGNVNVELIMKKLGGGGSFDRAGGFVSASLEATRQMLIEAINSEDPVEDTEKTKRTDI